jgi:hypothetical protein
LRKGRQCPGAAPDQVAVGLVAGAKALRAQLANQTLEVRGTCCGHCPVAEELKQTGTCHGNAGRL